MGSNGAMGAVRVANEVIASIAALAACEIEGVSGMDEAAARHFGDWVRRQTAHRGVRVQLEADRSIHLDVFITVDSEAKLAQVANAVQDNVVEATERMLGLEVGEVEVLSYHAGEGATTPDVAAFAGQLVRGVIANREKLDAILSEASDNWKLEQMAKVDRIVLRIAVYEITIDRRVPTKAAINESIELAKTFSGDEAGRFVNGILGRVAATVT